MSISENGVAQILDETVAFIRRYVLMSDHQSDAVALWICHTHAFAAAESTPYLHVTSAERESGKTRLLECLELVAARPMKTGGTTAAALARAVAQDPPPTLLLDETDNAFKRDREYVAALLGILNDGYRRGGRTLLCLPPKWDPTFLPVFAPKVVAGIGDLPDTLQSRSIRLELKRRAPGEKVSRFRRRDAEAEAEPVSISLASLAQDHTPALEHARPQLPDELGDRAQDCWEPLIAIADLAGGDWPARARACAIGLSSALLSEDDSLGVRLLGDIRQTFDEANIDRLATTDLLAHLHADLEAPWGDMRGKPLVPRTLARLLKPYGVRPRSINTGDGKNPRGFLREWFDDAFARYLAPLSATSATSAQPSGKTALFDLPPEPPSGTYENGANPHEHGDVAEVADRTPETGAKGVLERLHLGDPGFAMQADADYVAGHITDAELRELLHLDAVAAKSRAT